MTSRITQIALLVFTMAVSSACVTTRKPLQPTFWQDTHRTIGVAVMPLPPMVATRAGSQGLLDAAINGALAAGLESYVQTLDPNRFSVVADLFVDKLKERGFEARRIAQPIDPNRFPEFHATASGDYSPRDLRALASQEGVDALLLLSAQCGTIRNYYGFIPLDDPQGRCSSQGQLIDLKTNRIEWLTIEIPATIVTVIGPWDQPPDFPNVTAAIDRAVSLSQKFLVSEFFGAPPKVKQARR